tara:strand:- start:219 stop:380 length:162 start_codon:yes stop_codon:yes gene_type:complete
VYTLLAKIAAFLHIECDLSDFAAIILTQISGRKFIVFKFIELNDTTTNYIKEE